MAIRLRVTAHLTVDELLEHYRRCENAVEKTHWHVIWLKARGMKTGEIADVTGFQRNWVQQLIQRYNRHGPEGLRDRRADNGRALLLDETQLGALRAALAQPPPGGGLWSGPKVAQWIAERVGHPVSAKRGWLYLRRLNFTLQKPRPRHAQADEVAQAAFKKNSASWSQRRRRSTRWPPSSSGRRTKPASA